VENKSHNDTVRLFNPQITNIYHEFTVVTQTVTMETKMWDIHIEFLLM